LKDEGPRDLFGLKLSASRNQVLEGLVHSIPP
jgi:hypothetical protein